MAVSATGGGASTALQRLGLAPRAPRPFRVMVLGQAGVGKSALVVRFLTRRFIGEYAPALERVYSHTCAVDGEPQAFEVLDWAGGPSGGPSEGPSGQPWEASSLETKLRWADAFILVYSVTDQCSFDECVRLRFLISHARRHRHRHRLKDGGGDAPVMLVGTKCDEPAAERMVATAVGRRRARDLACAAFAEVGVRESPDAAFGVFAQLARLWRRDAAHSSAPAPAAPRLQRSSSDLPPEPPPASAAGAGPFRARAGTDGQLLLARRPAPAPAAPAAPAAPQRRMSMSMRGFPAGC